MQNITGAHNEFDIQTWVKFLIRAREEEPPWVAPVFMISVYFTLFMSLVGNLLTCTVIYMDKEMHTATNYYLFNLAVSDLIVTLTLFLGALDSFEYGHWSCKVNIFFILVLWNNSVLTITVLSVERYIAIWYPLRQKPLSVWRRVLKIITGIWIMAVVVTIPEIWSVNIVKTSHSLFCSIVPTPVARVINGVMGIVTFAVPLMIMTVVYIMIAIKVNVAQSSKSGSKVFNHRDDGRRVNKLVTLTLSFILCWLPYFVIRILIFALEIYQLLALVKWWSLLQRLMILNSSFSLVLNPILFSLISTKFKESLMIFGTFLYAKIYLP